MVLGYSIGGGIYGVVLVTCHGVTQSQHVFIATVLGPVHTGRRGARKCCTQKMEHIVANWSVHTALQTIASNIKGFASKFACKSAYASCVNGALGCQCQCFQPQNDLSRAKACSH